MYESVWATYEFRAISAGDAKGFLASLFDENRLVLEYDGRMESGERYTGIFRCKLDANCQSSLSPCELSIYENERRTGVSDARIKREQ